MIKNLSWYLTSLCIALISLSAHAQLGSTAAVLGKDLTFYFGNNGKSLQGEPTYLYVELTGAAVKRVTATLTKNGVATGETCVSPKILKTGASSSWARCTFSILPDAILGGREVNLTVTTSSGTQTVSSDNGPTVYFNPMNCSSSSAICLTPSGLDLHSANSQFNADPQKTTIYLAPGLYSLPEGQSLSFNRTVFISGSPDQESNTVIQATQPVNKVFNSSGYCENCTRVMQVNAPGQKAIVVGVNITNGWAPLNGSFSNGGGVHASGLDELEFSWSAFDDNRCNVQGCGFFSTNVERVTLKNSLFLNNKGVLFDSQVAGSGAAGRIISSDYVTMHNLGVENNIAQISGAFEVIGGDLKINSSSFRGNRASQDTSGYGGAVRIYQGTTTSIRRSSFIDNSAAAGGAIYSFHSGSEGLKIDYSLFTDNQSKAGGAIHSYFSSSQYTSVEINNSSFENNSATNPTPSSSWAGFGGAIKLQGGYNPQQSLALNYNRFINNSASLGVADVLIHTFAASGGILLEASHNNLIHSLGTTAGDWLQLTGPGSLSGSIRDSIFYSTQNMDSCPFSIANSSTLLLSHLDLYNVGSSECGNIQSLMTADPLFVDQNYCNLSAQSVMLDAASDGTDIGACQQ